jgi:spoIIIJ-associated protein
MQNAQIEKLVTEFFKETGVHSGEVSFSYDEDTKTMWCGISVADGRLLTGKNGETLAAINHLVRKIVEKSMGLGEDHKSAVNVIVDINGFQKKKVDAIKAVAHMMAERARFFKSSIEVDPMTPFERRIVHEFLSSMTDLKTESIGEGNKRRVVIKYIGNENTI